MDEINTKVTVWKSNPIYSRPMPGMPFERITRKICTGDVDLGIIVIGCKFIPSLNDMGADIFQHSLFLSVFISRELKTILHYGVG
jgi:hypothetical protein